MTSKSNQVRNRVHERAEAAFTKKQEQLEEGKRAMAEYQASHHAMLQKTARLRALRLARDAAERLAPSPKRAAAFKPAASSPKKAAASAQRAPA